jgi:cbb3-type cytochrome oxidase subunit 3
MSLSDIWFAVLGKIALLLMLLSGIWWFFNSGEASKKDAKKESSMTNLEQKQNVDSVDNVKTAFGTAKSFAIAGAIFGLVQNVLFTHVAGGFGDKIAVLFVVVPVWAVVAGVVGFIWGKIRGQ